MTNRQIRLRRRPVGAPTAHDFSIVDSAMPVARDGEVLRRTIYLSLDPYMRGRMNDARSYAPSLALDDVIVGGTVSEVIESKHPSWHPGDLVVGMDGWQQYASSAPTGLRPIDGSIAPISTALGVLGMPGPTAYVGCSTSAGRSPVRLEAVLRQINRGARIPLCGLISQYNATDPPSGPNLAPDIDGGALHWPRCPRRMRARLNQRLGATGIPASYLSRLWVSAILAAGAGWGVRMALPALHPLFRGAIVLPVFGAAYLGAAMVMGIPLPEGLRRFRRT